MKLYQLILPGIVTILGGCAVSPTVDPPPLAYRIPDSFAIDAELVSPYAYLSHFHDSGLASYVQRVLERNNDLRVALNNLKVAKQEAIINGAARLPSLSAGFTPSRSRVNSKQSNGSVVSSTSNNYNLGLNFSWEIDVWGRFTIPLLRPVLPMNSRKSFTARPGCLWPAMRQRHIIRLFAHTS